MIGMLTVVLILGAGFCYLIWQLRLERARRKDEQRCYRNSIDKAADEIIRVKAQNRYLSEALRQATATPTEPAKEGTT